MPSDPEVTLSWVIWSRQSRGKHWVASRATRALRLCEYQESWFKPAVLSRAILCVWAWPGVGVWFVRWRGLEIPMAAENETANPGNVFPSAGGDAGGCGCKHRLISFAFLKATDSAFASWESSLKGHRGTNWSFELCLEGPSSRDSVFLLAPCCSS